MAPAEPEHPAARAAGRPCGTLGCRAFASPIEAFEHALATRPRAIGVGESHAQKGAPEVASATRRFAEELLPALAGRTKHLVIELLTTDGRCGEATEREVKERQKPVTEPQAEGNQNEFLELGFAAKRLGIMPHALTPTCEELTAVNRAGAADIERLLALIADASLREAERLLAGAAPEETLVLYGGALHNDLAPREGREAWSFAPQLKARAGSYTEIDLVVPEFVKATPPWQNLPWYDAFVALPPSEETVLFNPSPGSYVLIFPRTRPSGTEQPG